MAGLQSRASLRSAADDFDELYQGFDEASLLDTQKQLAEDAGLQRVIQSSRSGQANNGQGSRTRPESRIGVQTAKAIGRRPTGQQLYSANKTDSFRPASSTRGAGYTAKSGRSTSGSSGVGSPSGRLSSGTPVMVPSLEPGQSDTDQPSKRALADFKAWERELTVMTDQIAVLVLENASQKALDKMKDCFKIRKRMVEIQDWSAADKEHHLRPLLWKLGWYQAEVLTACSKYDEAVTVYNNLLENLTASTKEEQASILFRVIVLHRRRGAYQTALTFLHRLLDDLPGDSGHLRVAALNEAAACHVQLGRWDTAYKYCQMILQDAPYSAKAAFNSLVALAALTAPENKLQQAYTKLLGVQLPVSLDKRPSSAPGQLSVGQTQYATSRLWPKIQMEHYVRYIRNASQLMAHRNPDVIAGYDQCVEELGKSKWASAVIPALEMAKALLYLKQQNLTKAMEILSSHDRDEEEDFFRSQYCDLLCFLTFHRNNVQEAREFAKRSYESNKLSLQACTNLGSVEYAEANYAEALHYFQEAAMLNSADFRSSYYAGMALKGLGNPLDAMTIFQKLYSTHGQRPTVLFQIAQLYEEAEQFAEAFAFFEKIFALYPDEPLVLQRLGQLAHKLGDTGAALWYYNESHRVCRTNLEVLNWLGRFFVTSQFPEKAITYFAQAADLEPQTAKWGLLMANAMRRAGHLTDAYSTFVDLHQRFPDNIDCLKLLIRMSQELQVAPTDIAKYQKELQFLSRQGSSVEAAPVSRASTASITQNFGDGRLTAGRKATSGLPMTDHPSLKNVSLDLDDSDLAAFAEVRPPTASTRNVPKLARPPTGRNKPVQDDEDIATAGILPGFPSHR